MNQTETVIKPKRISVYGAGSWGTALALQLARNNVDVLLWDIDTAHVASMQEKRQNLKYLADITFPDNLLCSANLAELTQFADLHLLVVPSHCFREVLRSFKDQLHAASDVIWATKGLELDSGKLLHEVFLEECPQVRSHGVVSGPTFATEVALGLPTAMTVAAASNDLAQSVAAAFKGGNYRVYTSSDIVGVELGGAIKNVLAIAAGVSDGLGFGANARAAIITRGLAEMIRLGEAMGVSGDTLMGLSGVGDLVLTCTDDQSRNRRFGLALGKGDNVDEAIAAIGQVVEGAKTSQSIGQFAKRAGVEMPICQAVQKVIYENLPPKQAVKELLARRSRAEF